MRSPGLARDAVLTGGAGLAATGVGAVSSLLIARELGPAGRGVWGVVSSGAVLTGTALTIGVPFATAYAVARLEGEKRARLLRAAFVASLALSVLAAMAAGFVVAASAPGATLALPLLGAGIAAALVVNSVSQQALLTAATLGWYALVQIVPAVLMLIVVVMLAVGDELTVRAVAGTSVATTVLGAVLGWFVIRARATGGRLVERRPPAELAATLRPWLGFALLTFATTALTQIVQRVDLLIVEGYRGATDAGLYAVSVQIGDLLLVLPAALGFVVFRRGATTAENHWPDALRAIRWTALLSAAGAVAVGMAAAWLVPFLWGGAYEGSVSALRWLLPGVVALSVQSVVSNYVASRGRPRAVLFAWLTAAVLAIGGALVVVPEHGIEGAAIVASASYVLVLGLHVKPMREVRP